jgi:hypothetical protein
MPITITEIKNLQRFSNANFRKFECGHCKNEFYSIRQCKYCSPACKQSAYRMRLSSEETEPKENQNEKIPDTELKTDTTINAELNEKIKLYEQKIESITR